jgi:hypothetical protein
LKTGYVGAEAEVAVAKVDGGVGVGGVKVEVELSDDGFAVDWGGASGGMCES